MSGIEMVSNIKLSYRRLRNEGWSVDDDDEYEEEEKNAEVGKVNWRVRRWSRVRRVAGKKRPRIRIPGLRRFLKRKNKVISAVRVSWSKFFRRLKEGRPYVGDLFAGNYLFMQVTPSTLRCDNKSYIGRGLHAYTSKSSLGKIA